MNKFHELIEKLDRSCEETFWQGAADKEQIIKLESLMKIKLPNSLTEFLNVCGGGGIIDSEFSGIEDNDGSMGYGGTILGDTLTCRNDFNLPSNLIVVFFKENEICWCLDSSSINIKGEYSVVSYNLITKEVDGKLSEDFFNFFKEYVTMRTSD